MRENQIFSILPLIFHFLTFSLLQQNETLGDRINDLPGRAGTDRWLNVQKGYESSRHFVEYYSWPVGMAIFARPAEVSVKEAQGFPILFTSEFQ